MANMNTNNGYGIATYLHSGVYKFDPTARERIIATFREKVKDIPANCTYDATMDMFILDCPQPQGEFCDAVLRETITRYVSTELQSSAQEARAPHVQRFPQGIVGGMESESEGSDISVDDDSQPPPAEKPITAHIVVAGMSQGERVKLFTMLQLPEGMMRRVLSPETLQAQDIIATGVTCRAVRWQIGGHVFNGCDGVNSVLHVNPNSEELQLPEFPILSDSRPQDVLAAHALFEHKAAAGAGGRTGELPGVQNWLAGVAQTTQVEPGEAAELPKETKKMLATDEMYGTGRARIPKGYKVGHADEEYSSNDEETPPVRAVKKPGFASLLPGTAGRALGASDASDDETSGSDVKSKSNQTAMPSFASVFGKPENKIPPEQVGGGIASSPIPPSTPNRLPFIHTTNTPTSHSTTQQTTENPVWHDPKHAVVDRTGLTGHAGHTAAFQLENNSPFQESRKKQPIVARAPKNASVANGWTHNGSTIGKSSSVASVPSTTAATVQSNAQSAIPAAFEKEILRPKLPPARLVDTAPGYSTTAPKVPPGYAREAKRYPQSSMPATQSPRSEGNLVDAESVCLMDEPISSSPRVDMPTSRAVLQPQLPKHQKEARKSLFQAPLPAQAKLASKDDDDKPVIDKLAQFSPEFTRKRNTMNQQAGPGNKKGKGNNAPKPKVDLPLPSPPPPPKPKNIVNASSPLRKPNMVSNMSRRTPLASMPSGAVPVDGNAEEHVDATQDINAFTHLIFEIQQKQELMDDEEDKTLPQPILEAKVGLLLCRDDRLSRKEASSPEFFQALLNSSQDDGGSESVPINTSFLPRLTAETSDAAYLMGFFGNEEMKRQPSYVSYEVLITDAAGWMMKCEIPLEDPTQFFLTPMDKKLGYAYLHHPYHVWDARIALIQPGDHTRKSPSLMAMQEFAASMQTEGEAPSFRARISQGNFVVEDVRIVRIYQLDTGSYTYNVIEKQQLNTEAMPGEVHNFRALAAPREVMVDTHRLWWELSLTTKDLDNAEQLQQRICMMVQHIDGVGRMNEGPWERPVEDETDGEVKKPQMRYDELGQRHLEKLKSQI